MPQRPAARRVLPRSPFNKAEPEVPVTDWKVDDRVCHDARGVGTVLRVEGDTVVVDFGDGDVCRVSSASPKLAPL